MSKTIYPLTFFLITTIVIEENKGDYFVPNKLYMTEMYNSNLFYKRTCF